MDLLSKLEVFGRTVKRRYPYINCGGCAVYASALIQSLTEMGIGAHAAVCNEDSTLEDIKFNSIDEIRSGKPRNARQWNHVGLDFDHVITEFLYEGKMYLCDSDIIQTSCDSFDGYTVLDGRLDPEEIILVANDADGDWNHQFNRKLIPEIHQLFKREFGVTIQ